MLPAIFSEGYEQDSVLDARVFFCTTLGPFPDFRRYDSTSTGGQYLADTKVMRRVCVRVFLGQALLVMALVSAQSVPVCAQQNAFAAALSTSTASMSPPPVTFVPVTREVPRPHRFWDNKNRVLFASVAAFSAGDFLVTRANLANGGRELNPVTRLFTGSTPALATNFALETGSVVGISYFFHRSGHHRLERLTSVVDIGASAGAIAYGMAHR